jgi:hypothetical protein
VEDDEGRLTSINLFGSRHLAQPLDRDVLIVSAPEIPQSADLVDGIVVIHCREIAVAVVDHDGLWRFVCRIRIRAVHQIGVRVIDLPTIAAR